ncbi:MAG: molybdopterin molybdenumtransferase MoeA, partial [Syntrophobacterales bacterium CG_4_8_14_3_um_filter_49_14]
KIFRKTIRARLKEDIKKRKGLTHFVRAVVEDANGGYTASSTGEQGSGILKSMVRANGLIVLPEETEFVKAGDEVTVQIIDDSLKLTVKPEYL